MSNLIKLILTAMLAVSTGILAYLWMNKYERAQASFKVYEVKTDLIANQSTIFTDGNITTRSFPEKYRNSMSESVMTVDPALELAYQGRMVNRDVPAGSLLLFEYLREDEKGDLSRRVKVGKRALTIPVNAGSTVGFFVEPGSLVDVLGTVIEAKEQHQQIVGTLPRMRLTAKTLLQSVRVMAVGKATDIAQYRRSARNGYSTVTVEVTPLQAEQLVFAMQQVQGGLTLVLRNSDDSTFVDLPNVNWENWQTSSQAGNK